MLTSYFTLQSFETEPPMPPAYDLDAVDFPHWLNKASRNGNGEDALIMPAPASDRHSRPYKLPPPVDFEEALQQANLHFCCQEYDEALLRYEAIVRGNATNGQCARASYNIGIVKMHQDRPNDAIQAFQDAYSNDSNLIAPIFARGCILWSLDRFREASETFLVAKRLFEVRHDSDVRAKPPKVDPGLETVFHFTKVHYNTTLAQSRLPGARFENDRHFFELHPMDRSKLFESEFGPEEKKIGKMEKVKNKAHRYSSELRKSFDAGVDRLNGYVR